MQKKVEIREFPRKQTMDIGFVLSQGCYYNIPQAKDLTIINSGEDKRSNRTQERSALAVTLIVSQNSFPSLKEIRRGHLQIIKQLTNHFNSLALLIISKSDYWAFCHELFMVTTTDPMRSKTTEIF